MRQQILWVTGSASQTTSGTTANFLKGIDAETGAILYKGATGKGTVKGHIVLSGDGHLCSWSPQ